MPDEALVAHLLRRTGFGPRPGEVERLARGGIHDAIETVLRARPPALSRAPKLDDSGEPLMRWWLERMLSPGAGLHEKLTWFWHGHFTSSIDKVDGARPLWSQHLLLRRHALGSFRDLVHQLTVDPAMLQYLDGDGSTGDSPNENYARELMELFTLGRGNYAQADVRAAARGLAGWSVDDGRARFDRDSAWNEPVTLLGRTGVLRAADVVDTVVSDRACAPSVAGRIHRWLCGVDASAERRDALAERFRASGLSIRVLVEDVVRHPQFLELRLNRPRWPVEWITAALVATGRRDPQVALDLCYSLGQVPFEPPNVAGWPGGRRWLSASQALVRAADALEAQALRDVMASRDMVGATLRRCSLYEVSDETREALGSVAGRIADREQRAQLLLAVAVASPEMALA
jgi:uncharacterized protein (DUF1800 family)